MKYTLLVQALIVMLAFLVSCNPPEKKIKEDVLWYKQPAEDWNEAMPLGNGKLGAMVFGRTSNERIQLNDDSMWPAGHVYGSRCTTHF